MKGHHYWFYRNKKNYERGLWTIVYHQIGLPRWSGQFLKMQNLVRINQNKKENLNRPITSKDVTPYFFLLSHKYKISQPEKAWTWCFTGEFHQTFKELMPNLLKLFWKIEER